MLAFSQCKKTVGMSVRGALAGASRVGPVSGKFRGTLNESMNFHKYSKHGHSPFTLAIRASSTKVHVGGVSDKDEDSSSISRSSSSGGEVSKSQKAKEGFKELWTKYGTVAITTYLGVYVSTLTSVFFALDYDIFGASTFGLEPADAIHKVADLIESFSGSTEFPGYVKENPRMGTFAIAWVMTKFTEPARLFLTLGIVPTISRSLGYAPPKEKKAKKSAD